MGAGEERKGSGNVWSPARHEAEVMFGTTINRKRAISGELIRKDTKSNKRDID
jgi:hypothetical protein